MKNRFYNPYTKIKELQNENLNLRKTQFESKTQLLLVISERISELVNCEKINKELTTELELKQKPLKEKFKNTLKEIRERFRNRIKKITKNNNQLLKDKNLEIGRLRNINKDKEKENQRLNSQIKELMWQTQLLEVYKKNLDILSTKEALYYQALDEIKRLKQSKID